MSRLRYHIANTLYHLFPSRFCWADLACWQMGGEPFWRILKHWGEPTGCIVDSKVPNDDHSCYCGSWYKGKNCMSKEGKKLLSEMRNEQETEELITNEPPF